MGNTGLPQLFRVLWPDTLDVLYSFIHSAPLRSAKDMLIPPRNIQFVFLTGVQLLATLKLLTSVTFEHRRETGFPAVPSWARLYIKIVNVFNTGRDQCA
jgi:hypothetical protein